MLNITFNGKFIIATGNVNWGQTNIPQINEAMAAAENVIGQRRARNAWAKIDEELVEKRPRSRSTGTSRRTSRAATSHGVGELWNVGEWDYSYTSLK